MRFVFGILANILTVYSFLCFIRIMMSWVVPHYSTNPIVQFLYQLCDPYLNVFRGLSFLRMGYMDFSPVLAIALLSGITSICSKIAASGILTVGSLLAMLVSVVGTVIASMLFLLIILTAVRLVADIVAPHSTFALWSTLDRLLYPFLSGIVRTIVRNRIISRKMAYFIGLVAFLLLDFSVQILFGTLYSLLVRLPI
ncbi:MAG: YggT family protein [Treponemataceae bacterium]|nr:MAG: YggT family protein [Treponemataceae bacterium]